MQVNITKTYSSSTESSIKIISLQALARWLGRVIAHLLRSSGCVLAETIVRIFFDLRQPYDGPRLNNALPWDGFNCYLIAATEALLATHPALAHSVDNTQGVARRYLQQALEVSNGTAIMTGNQLVASANRFLDTPRRIGEYGDPVDVLTGIFENSALPTNQLFTVRNGQQRPLRTPLYHYQCRRCDERRINIQEAVQGSYAGLTELNSNQENPPEFFTLAFRDKRHDQVIDAPKEVLLDEQSYQLRAVVIYVNQNHYYSLEAQYGLQGEISGWVKRDMGRMERIPHSADIENLLQHQGDLFMYGQS